MLTTCPYCGVGCGVEARGRRHALAVTGDSTHPANFGRLCSKGSALGETIRLEGRLLHPMIGESRTTWPRAIRLVADTLSETIAAHGPDSVAFYVSGQLLTEDYYVANKLMKGFIGSSNIDTNSRLCMASAVVAHKLAFGEDVVPGCYEDVELADLVVFVGHNAAWTHPVLYRRMESALARGQRHIVLDPRATDTTRGAFLHLKLKPQTDVRLWNGLLAHLCERGAIDDAFVSAHTRGLGDVLRALARDDQSIAAVARDCDLDPDDVRLFYETFRDTSRTVTLFSQGVNQSIDGVAKGLAILNAHLAMGRVSKPGASPFSITGQPNAMGGRETGGMATTLAAHMDFTPEDKERLARFWRAPRLAQTPGLKAVDMFDAVADGRIKALWVIATNPAISMPDAGRVRAALAACPFVVVSDVIADTDTAKFAHVRLPAQAWGEKDGTVTNSERRISRQRAFLPAPGAARADWRILADVASHMGFADAFSYASAHDIFREYAALTVFENDGARLLNLGALSQLDATQYDALAPSLWPVRDDEIAQRPFASGDFSTPDRRARFIAPEMEVRAENMQFPVTLNTGRIRDQWHTMTRTGLSPRLMRHAPEPFVDIHPTDAESAGVIDGALATVATAFGEATLTAHVTDSVRRGDLFAPMHWSDAFAPNARVNVLVNPDVDAASGQPEFKRTPAAIAPSPVAWRAFFVTRTRRDPPSTHENAPLWWRRIPQDIGHLYEIASPPGGASFHLVARILLGASTPDDEIVSATDSSGAFLRQAVIQDNCLQRAFFATSTRGLPQRDWLIEKLAAPSLSDDDRRALLVGGAPGASRGPTVCACYNVGRAAIEALAASEPDAGVARVSAVLKAGGNCGSCKPEIMQILVAMKEKAHAS